MATILPFRQSGRTCPVCHRRDGEVIVHHLFIGYCDRHKTRWLTGFKTPVGWPNDTEADWEVNAARLKDYEHSGPNHCRVRPKGDIDDSLFANPEDEREVV